MLGRTEGPVVCVSYVALAELWSVPQFPVANHGATVRTVDTSIAADGPMTAAVLSALNVPNLLIANYIGTDQHGVIIRDWLRRFDVRFTATPFDADVESPWIVVVADSNATRTWFAHLPGVADRLDSADLSSVYSASFVYVDAYPLIEKAAVRVIEHARAVGVPLLVNLGGEPVTGAVHAALIDYEDLIIQTNIDDYRYQDAGAVAKSLRADLGAAWTVVTTGAYGAIALNRSGEEISVPGFSISVHHTHCAGAAFSGGLLYGLREGWSMHRSMVLGSASGALRCARHQSAPLPTLADLEMLIASSRWDAAS